MYYNRILSILGELMKSIEERFWSKVNKTDSCWLWTASTSRGYGKFFNGDKIINAHRYSFILHRGIIPAGLYICHTCDNRICVNPDHLFLGTNQDNMNDMKFKNRQTKGISINTCKLTKQQVIEIRNKYTLTLYTAQRLASEYNVSYQNIYSIIHNKSWKHV